MISTSKRIASLFLVISFCVAAQEWQPLRHYAQTSYNILFDYVKQHPAASAVDVEDYIKTGALSSVIKQGQNLGYERIQILQATYALAIDSAEKCEPILYALRNQLRHYYKVKRIVAWTTVGCAMSSPIFCGILAWMTGKMFKDWLRT